MPHAKETEISSDRLGLWLESTFTFFYLSWVPYNLQFPDAAKVKQIKNWPKVLPTILGCIITKISWGGGDYGNLNLFVTAHKKIKLKNQVRKTEKSL